MQFEDMKSVTGDQRTLWAAVCRTDCTQIRSGRTILENLSFVHIKTYSVLRHSVTADIHLHTHMMTAEWNGQDDLDKKIFCNSDMW